MSRFINVGIHAFESGIVYPGVQDSENGDVFAFVSIEGATGAKDYCNVDPNNHGFIVADDLGEIEVVEFSKAKDYVQAV